MTVDDPTHVLGAWIAILGPDAIPGEVRDHAADLLLDSFACALAAHLGEETTQVTAVADAMGGVGEATVIGERRTRDLASAVFLNGFRITAITACDVYAPADLHTTPEVVPPALAIAERRGATGAALLTGVVAGLETAVRMARGFDAAVFRERGWHAPGVIGPFGAAAAAASLAGLDAAGATDALALAGSQSAGTWAARGTPAVKFHQARAATSGLLAGLLAAEGFRGARRIATAPEGGLYTAYAPGDAERVVGRLGVTWVLDDISIRLWPGGARVQPAMTAASLLVQDGLRWDEVDRVTVRVAPRIATAQAWASDPTGTFAALASIPYTVAVTLRFGAATADRFAATGYEDPETRAFLANRIEVVGDERVPDLGATVEVSTTDGGRRSATVEVPKGHPTRRATREELADKVHACADDVIGPDATDELIDRVRGIEAQQDLGPILRILRSSARP